MELAGAEASLFMVRHIATLAGAQQPFQRESSLSVDVTHCWTLDRYTRCNTRQALELFHQTAILWRVGHERIGLVDMERDAPNGERFLNRALHNVLSSADQHDQLVSRARELREA